MMVDQTHTPTATEPQDRWLWFIDEKLVATLFHNDAIDDPQVVEAADSEAKVAVAPSPAEPDPVIGSEAERVAGDSTQASAGSACPVVAEPMEDADVWVVSEASPLAPWQEGATSVPEALPVAEAVTFAQAAPAAAPIPVVEPSAATECPFITDSLAVAESFLVPESDSVAESLVAEPTTGSPWQQASYLFAARQFDEALALYRELLLAKPNDPALLYNAAVCLAELGRYGEALNGFESALGIAPGLSQAREGLAWCLLRLRQPQSALDIFERQIRHSPTNTHALKGRAQALHLLSRIDEAKTAYDELLSADHRDADILANLIAIAAEKRDSEALRQYSEYLLKVRSRSRQAIAGLASAELIDGKYGLARKHAANFLEVEPRSYEGWFNYGLASQMLNEFETAEHSYREASDLNPKKVEPHINRGCSCLAIGDLPGAQLHFEAALNLDPDSSTALWNLGLLFEASEHFEEAEEQFSRLASIETKHAGAPFHIGLCHFMRGNWAMSIAAFQRSLHIDPNSLESLIYLGLAHWNNGNRDAAASSFDQALERDPVDVPALQCRTELALSTGDLQSAPELEARLADLGKTTPEFCFNLGMLHFEAKEYDAAAQCFRRAVAKRPAFGDALLNLGYALEALGKHEQAMAVWRDVMTVEPELPFDYFQAG